LIASTAASLWKCYAGSEFEHPRMTGQVEMTYAWIKQLARSKTP
jgi:hypothetical protein